MKQHGNPPSALSLLLLDRLVGVIGGFLPFRFQHVAAPEVLKGLLTASASEAFEVQRRTSPLVNRNGDGLFLHSRLPPCEKLQPDLLAFVGLDNFPGFQDVALATGHSQSLLLLVKLLHMPQPLRSVAVVLVE